MALGESRRAVLALSGGIAGTAALGLAACGGTSGAPEKRVRTSVSTVRFLALGGGAALQWQEQQFARFNESVGAAAKVQLRADPEANQTILFQKFQASTAAGDPPDVTRLKEVWVFESAARGALLKLDTYFKGDKDLPLSDLIPRFQESVRFRGSYYAVARECSILIPFYNKELFAGAGLDPEKPPTTYEAFRDSARRLTKVNPDPSQTQWGFDVYEFGTREIIMFWYLGFVRRFGGDFWNRDKTGIAINSPAGYESMEYLVDMIQKDRSTVAPGLLASPWDTGRTTGKVAMWETGTWQIPVYASRFPDLKFGIMLWPKKTTANQSPSCGSSAIHKDSKDPDAAWEFVKWWNAPEQQIGFYENSGGNSPSRRSVFDGPPFTTNPLWKIALPGYTSPDGKARPSCERYDELAMTLTPHLMAAWQGQKSPRQAVDDASTAATEFWKSIGGNASKAEG